MLKKVSLLFVILAVLVSPRVVMGVTTTTDSASPEVSITEPPKNSEEVREMVRKRILKNKELREKIKERVQTHQEKREEMRGKLTEKKKKRVRRLFARITKRIKAAISRLELLIARINKRLDILAGEGEDVTDIRIEIAQAEELLESAKGSLADAESLLEDALSSDNPKESFAVIRDTVKSMKSTLVGVHRILVKVIGDIKELRVGTTNNND